MLVLAELRFRPVSVGAADRGVAVVAVDQLERGVRHRIGLVREAVGGADRQVLEVDEDGNLFGVARPGGSGHVRAPFVEGG
nr:hypothetical protein [Amycolatopsis eburnea]